MADPMQAPEASARKYVLETLPLLEGVIVRAPGKGVLSKVAEETVRCCTQGRYRNSEYEDVPLPVEAAVNSTRLLPAGAELPALPARAAGASTVISVVQASTLAAAETLCRQGLNTCVLNFASAKNPGGGFLRGASAQEESLARSSALYPCLLKPEVQDFYRDNKADTTCVYTDHLIVSHAVPVFRRDDGQPLDAPYCVSMLTAPAPNMGVAAGRVSLPEVGEARRRRMERVLAFMAEGSFDAVVLGAWGCGVFKNEPCEVASEFKALLCTRFQGAFSRVVFAVYDEPTCQVFDSMFSATDLCIRERGGGGGDPAQDPAENSHEDGRRGGRPRKWGRGRAGPRGLAARKAVAEAALEADDD